MTCDEALELLSAALDGELSPAERNTLDAHLAECPGCAALFDQLAGQSRLLRDLECEVPDGLSERILSGLPGQAPARRGRVIHWRRWGTLAACLALVVWAGFSLPQSAKNAAPQADLASAVPENQAEENPDAISAPTSLDESPGPAAFSLEPREASDGDTAAGNPPSSRCPPPASSTCGSPGGRTPPSPPPGCWTPRTTWPACWRSIPKTT